MMIFNSGVGGYGFGKSSCGLGGRELNKDAKTEAFNMIGQRLNLCQRQIPMTSFNSWTDWTPSP